MLIPKRPGRLISLAGLCLAGSALGVLPSAQGKFVNFEAPQIKPIAIATVQGASYVLACNTPDNSVEVYESLTGDLITRVPVGLSPVTVRWNAAQQKFYTCNFIGDSVSVVRLDPRGVSVIPILERTVHVGDSPTDIAFDATAGEALVALHSRSMVGHYDDQDLSPITDANGPVQDVLPPPAPTGQSIAIKEPRQLGFLGDRFVAINTRGGNRPAYEADLYVDDPSAAQPYLVNDMNSTNTAFAHDADEDLLYLVGGLAGNNDASMVENVAALPTGFVRSFLWIVKMTPTGTPGETALRVAEQSPIPPGDPPGTNDQFPLWTSIDLNRDYRDDSGIFPIDEVDDRVSQPTDVVLVSDASGVTHVVIACFGSDDVLVLEPDEDANGGWARTHVAVNLIGGGGYGATGPRGLAYDSINDRVWVLCRLDNSLAAFTPGSPTVQLRRSLSSDPTPTVIREGRPFLYSANQTSGGHMVACASCHIDGRTDGLRWDLGASSGTPTPIPQVLVDEDPANLPGPFRLDKGNLVTQTLQGLVNFHTETTDTQYILTNAPYHWRGDKAGFEDFNEAFVNLQGMPPLDGEVVGLSEAQMTAYRRFIDTIQYPPNPEQDLARTYDGEFALGSEDPNDLNFGSGAKLGLKIFHLLDSMEQKACVHCHTLPEGSSNTYFLTAAKSGGTGTIVLENAAVRGLFQREKALVRESDPEPFDPTNLSDWIRVADRGLQRNGQGKLNTETERSINDFNAGFGLPDNLSNNSETDLLRALNKFVREFDWGTSPMIGQVLSIDTSIMPAGSPTLDPLLHADIAAMEASAREANSGVAVYLRKNDGSKVVGYWYDCATVAGPIYRKVEGGITKSRNDLLDLVSTSNDLIVFQAVPTGSERRVADKSGAPSPLTGDPIANVALLPMVPNTAYVGITDLTENVVPDAPGTAPGAEEFRSIDNRIELEAAVLLAQQQPGADFYGVADTPRHEPPRRFRIAGENIRHGAKLRLGMLQGAPASPSSQSGEGRAWIEFDLVPTGNRLGASQELVVWETPEEIDALMTMAFLNGGPELQRVQDHLNHLTPTLDPATWNDYEIEVVNEAGAPFSLSGQHLSIADQR